MINYNQIPDRVNDRIRFIRKKNNYTQKEIADFLNIDRGTYAKYESGNRTIPIEAVTGLAAVYSVSTDFILGVSNNPEHINYGEYITGLSDKAIFHLQRMYDCHRNAFKAINSILEDDSAYMIFQSLGLLLRTPKDFGYMDLKCDKDLAQMIMYLFFEASETKLPADIFNISEAESLQFGNINFDMWMETCLQSYLRDFIEKIRTLPETKRDFANELMRLYMYRAKKELDEIGEADA